jgi:hypothetical protein
VKEFPFFPFFHSLYSTRANVNPPVVITGVGPTGRKIVHLQPPSSDVVPVSPPTMPFPDHLIDPALMGLMATPGRAVSPVVSRGSTPIHWSPMPSSVKITVTVETLVKPAKENQDPVKHRNTSAQHLVLFCDFLGPVFIQQESASTSDVLLLALGTLAR